MRKSATPSKSRGAPLVDVADLPDGVGQEPQDAVEVDKLASMRRVERPVWPAGDLDDLDPADGDED